MARHLAGVSRDLRIVFVSGYTDAFDDVESLAGVRSVLIRKPVDRATLLKALRDVLK